MSPFDHTTTCHEVATAFSDKIKGRTFLITGTTANGLGANAALTLARHSPAHLILVSRTRAKSEPVLQEIATINPNIALTFVTCELSDFDSVRAAAAQINADASIPHIDVVLNNAGVMAIPEYTLDKQGYELTLSSNHLGHFLLTSLILPKILASPDPRVVNVTSRGHTVGPFRFADWNFSSGKAYDRWSAYGQSKTANILFSVELARRGLRSYAVHPGGIWETHLTDHLQEGDFEEIGEISRRNNGRVTFVLDGRKTRDQGTAPLLAAMLDPAFEERPGSFINETCQVAEALDYATSAENAKKLWTLSEELVGQKFDL
ncbi:retinol dehydrogenase 13 [Whalleya microplaca]|nr:retinol dehydrogenase 13 [Whalleya microplaca]